MRSIILIFSFLLCSVFSFAASDLKVTDVSAPTMVYKGSSVQVSVNCSNVGTTKMSSYIVKFYISRSSTYGNDAKPVGTAWGNSLNVGRTETLSCTFFLPADIARGTWYVHAVIVSRSYPDSNPKNDTAHSGPMYVN